MCSFTERAVVPSWQKTQVFCSGLVHLTIKIAPLGWCKDLLDGKFHMASTPLCGTTPELVQKQGCDKVDHVGDETFIGWLCSGTGESKAGDED